MSSSAAEDDRKPAPGEVGCTLGCVATIVVLIVLFIVASDQWSRSNLSPPDGMTASLTAELLLTTAIEEAGIQADDVRLVREHPWYQSKNSVAIYISKDAYERVPFPDRPSFVSRTGRVWCDGVHQKGYFTVVTFRNIRTGDEFAQYRCSESQPSQPN